MGIELKQSNIGGDKGWLVEGKWGGLSEEGWEGIGVEKFTEPRSSRLYGSGLYIISKGFGDRLDPSSSERDIEAKLEFKAAAANELTLNLPGEITWERNKAERKSGQMPDSGRLSGKIMAYKQIVVPIKISLPLPILPLQSPQSLATQGFPALSPPIPQS